MEKLPSDMTLQILKTLDLHRLLLYFLSSRVPVTVSKRLFQERFRLFGRLIPSGLTGDLLKLFSQFVNTSLEGAYLPESGISKAATVLRIKFDDRDYLTLNLIEFGSFRYIARLITTWIDDDKFVLNLKNVIENLIQKYSTDKEFLRDFIPRREILPFLSEFFEKVIPLLVDSNYEDSNYEIYLNTPNLLVNY